MQSEEIGSQHGPTGVTSVKVVEIPWRFEVGIVQAALGGSWSGRASVAVVSLGHGLELQGPRLGSCESSCPPHEDGALMRWMIAGGSLRGKMLMYVGRVVSPSLFKLSTVLVERSWRRRWSGPAGGKG